MTSQESATHTITQRSGPLSDLLTRDITAIGGFRYLYHQTMKTYGLSSGSKALDELFLNKLLEMKIS